MGRVGWGNKRERDASEDDADGKRRREERETTANRKRRNKTRYGDMKRRNPQEERGEGHGSNTTKRASRRARTNEREHGEHRELPDEAETQSLSYAKRRAGARLAGGPSTAPRPERGREAV